MRVAAEYQVIIVKVPLWLYEFAADVMMQFGAGAIEQIDKGEVVELRSVFKCDLDRLREALTTDCTVITESIRADVVDTWKQFATPVRINENLRVIPSWVPTDSIPGVREIIIDPRDTFGMGDHPTTMLSLRAIDKLTLKGQAFLDVGCGSGILAILAKKNGAGIVDAVDKSNSAVEVAIGNANRNHIELDQVSTWTDFEPRIAYDVVVANILAPVLIELAPALMTYTKSTGRLILAGLRNDQRDKVVAEYTDMTVREEMQLDGWICLILEKISD